MALAQCMAVAVAWRPTGAKVPAAGSPTTLDGSRQKAPEACSLPGGLVQRVSSMSSGGRHTQEPLQGAPSTSLPPGETPENILKKSPAHHHCFQIGYETEQKQKRLPSKRALSWLPGYDTGSPQVLSGVGSGHATRRCREIPASRRPWRHSPENA